MQVFVRDRYGPMWEAYFIFLIKKGALTREGYKLLWEHVYLGDGFIVIF